MAGIACRNGFQGMKKNYRLDGIRASIQFAACVLAGIGFTAASAQFEEGRLMRIQALKTPHLDGIVPTYYTPGYKQHARDLQRFVTGEMGFAQRRLGVQLPLSLAVLDKAQWSLAERQLPYPMPSVDGEPPVALMPADWWAAEDFFENESDIDSERAMNSLRITDLARGEPSIRGSDWRARTRSCSRRGLRNPSGHALVE